MQTKQAQVKDTETQIPALTNGMSEEQKRSALAAAGRYRNSPDFVERGQKQVAEYRKTLQEELERELTKVVK